MKKLLLLVAGTVILGTGSLMTAYAATPYCNVEGCTQTSSHRHEYCQEDCCGQPGTHSRTVSTDDSGSGRNHGGHNGRHNGQHH